MVGARLRDDVEALAGMRRGSAGAGERASAAWVARRLEEAGAAHVRIEPFRYQATHAWAHMAHHLPALAALRRPGPGGAALAGAALASLELEVSGRLQWIRRFLPAGDGANVTAVIPARGDSRRTLVLVAHHDAARTGLIWRLRQRVGTKRQARRRTITPAMGATGLAFGLAAVGALLPGAIGTRMRAVARGLLLISLAGYADTVTSPTVPGASDNATGVAALLELARALVAEPLDGVEVVLLAPGCEESGMGGMAAFLRGAGGALHPNRTLVLGLDTLGGGTPIVLSAEATLFPHSYGERELALAEAGARRAGVEPPERWRLGSWTDPILARFAGLPAISLLSARDGRLPEHHLMTDTPDRVDWSCVERCVQIARGIGEELAAAA